MRKESIIAAICVLFLMGTCAVAAADSSSAEISNGTYDVENVRTLSILTTGWSGTDTPHNLHQDGSGNWYYQHTNQDRDLFIYISGSQKDDDFKQWVDTCTGSSVKGSISASDKVTSGNDYVMYMFTSVDTKTLVAGTQEIKYDEDTLNMYKAQDYQCHIFKDVKNFKITNDSTTKELSVLFYVGLAGGTVSLKSEQSFENEYTYSDGYTTKTGYHYDSSDVTVRAIFTPENNTYIGNIEALEASYLSEMKYTVTNEWHTDSNGTGAETIAYVLLVLGICFVIAKFVINRKPHWSA